MTDAVSITIDGTAVAAPAGCTILDACDLAGVYVPRLCSYPGLPPLGDCGLCFVKVGDSEGNEAARRACSVRVTAGMTVSTSDEEALGFRRNSMLAILGDHQHVCLTCPQRYGCSRVECMYGYPQEDRCCDELGRCEIGGVAERVGALQRPPEYQFRGLGATQENNLRRDLDLCIGCGRCVAACEDLEEAGRCLQLVETAGLVGRAGGEGGPPEEVWRPRSYLGRHVALPKAGTLRASGCTFCGACVMVCPSGALTAAAGQGAAWLAKRRERTTLFAAVLPPEKLTPLTSESLALVPEGGGVFRVVGRDREVLQITGAANLRQALRAFLDGWPPGERLFFSFQEAPLYTQLETEMLARHLQQHGRLPRGNDVLGGQSGEDEDDLF